MRIYIAGPMRGYPNYNFAAFDRAAALLRSQGHTVYSPAEMDRDVGFDETKDEATPRFLSDAISRDLECIAKRCDSIYLLNGWSKSAGVQVELTLAKFLNLRVLYENVPRIIGFAGRLGAGKDAAAQALVELGWQKVAFSDAVWAAVLANDGVVRTGIHGEESFRPQQVITEYGGIENAKRKEPELRRMAQKMGTEVGRAILGETVWLDRLERRFDELPASPGVCISGVRFDNEAQWIRDRGGIVLEVYRDERPGVDPSGGQHASERGVSQSLVNGHLRNNGSMEELHAMVRTLAS